ncbi:MAG: hypothetical protein U1D35_04180 [Paracoccaceae bacterium]|nr:hypothetical protein [Paracoccaceae bacterium]
MLRILAFALLAPLIACGPVSADSAERQCFERASLAQSPRGMVAAGVGNGGTIGRVRLEVSSDYLQGRDPSAIYDACVYNLTGQPPRQPLYSRPDWKA